MKAVLFATLALLATAPIVRADIPHGPPVEEESMNKHLNGEEAHEMWDSIKGHEIPGDSLRTLASSYKVERSEDGLDQTICERISHRIEKKATEYHCTIEHSKNGRPLPVFHPLRRMG